jgi:hypothetical protein
MYTVGQKLWLVPSQRYLGEPREIAITKVGRKWLTLDGGARADVDGLVLDGGQYSPPGYCYATRDEWEAEKALNDEWSKLRRDIDCSRRVPVGTSVKAIHDARAILGL